MSSAMLKSVEKILELEVEKVGKIEALENKIKAKQEELECLKGDQNKYAALFLGGEIEGLKLALGLIK